MKQAKIIERQLTSTISKQIEKYPIIALTGPRQSGKTTLLKNMFPTYQYISLENTDQRSFAVENPDGFLKKYDSKVIFDEVQQAPSLFSYLQTKVDESGEMGQFILSGSQNFQLLEQITQSLAGRVAIFKLLPFDFHELKNANILPENWKSLLIKGFYPAIYDRNLNPSPYYSNYLQTYINRDVTALVNIHDHKRFNNFIRLCAGRAGQLLNISNIANECGISQPTAKSWLSILESSYIIFLLLPYFENFNKRVVKTPKLYFYDTGLLSFLLGLRHEDDLDENQTGHLFENLILSEIQKRNYHQNQLKDYYFWRDSNGNEVDLLSKYRGIYELYEVKSTQTILPKLFKSLDFFDALISTTHISKNLIYGGNENQQRTKYNVSGWEMNQGATLPSM